MNRSFMIRKTRYRAFKPEVGKVVERHDEPVAYPQKQSVILWTFGIVSSLDIRCQLEYIEEEETLTRADNQKVAK